MPLKCPRGKPRYRYRKIKGGKQRLGFCGKEVKEIKTMKKGKVKFDYVKHTGFSRGNWGK